MSTEYYEAACKLWEKTEGVGLTIGDSKESLNKYLKRNPKMSFVCFDKNSRELIGTVLGGNDGRRGFIYHLAVHNSYRNQSIGKSLLELSIAALKKTGIERCIIMVKADNIEGVSFWNKIGWRKRDDLVMFSSNIK